MVIYTIGGLFAISVFVLFLSQLQIDTSTVTTQRGSYDKNEKISTDKQRVKTSKTVKWMLDTSAQIENSKGSRGRIRRPKRDFQIKYNAKQVIVREGHFDSDKTIPTGTNLIGKLLTSIDTREKTQIYKVLLPYGGKSKGGGEIPKNTMLFGKIRYSGKGTKVFITFKRGVFPNGREFNLEAQALNTKSYSPGITGVFHGKGATRIATSLGLVMVSGMANVLVEKREVGQTGGLTAKATLKNGLYQGISQASQMEAQRQAAEINSESEYVTIDSGQDLIINLTRSYTYE